MNRELGEKGTDYVIQVLFVGVPKVKVKIAHRGVSGLAYGFDVLNDRGTNGWHQQLSQEYLRIYEPENTLAGAGYE